MSTSDKNIQHRGYRFDTGNYVANTTPFVTTFDSFIKRWVRHSAVMTPHKNNETSVTRIQIRIAHEMMLYAFEDRKFFPVGRLLDAARYITRMSAEAVEAAKLDRREIVNHEESDEDDDAPNRYDANGKLERYRHYIDWKIPHPVAMAYLEKIQARLLHNNIPYSLQVLHNPHNYPTNAGGKVLPPYDTRPPRLTAFERFEKTAN